MQVPSIVLVFAAGLPDREAVEALQELGVATLSGAKCLPDALPPAPPPPTHVNLDITVSRSATRQRSCNRNGVL